MTASSFGWGLWGGIVSSFCPLCGNDKPWTCPRWHSWEQWKYAPWVVALLAFLAIGVAREVTK